MRQQSVAPPIARIASYLGLVLGQLILVMHPGLGLELLMLVALCFTLCLVPVALTRRIHPAPLHPAPMEPRFFLKRVPQSLSTVLGAGLIVGSFYGLAPLYACPSSSSSMRRSSSSSNCPRGPDSHSRAALINASQSGSA